MRIVYSDPISELISLVETSDLSKVSYIALSRDEMRLLVTNARAPALFPEHFGEAERLIARMENEIKRCDRELAALTLSIAERDKIFDRKLNCERVVSDKRNEVPKTLTFQGVELRTVLR